MARKKHVPQRTCIICRNVKAKRELIRIVKTPSQTLILDETGKAPGRGAYLCKDGLCRQDKAISRGVVSRALKVAISDNDWLLLQDALDSLP